MPTLLVIDDDPLIHRVMRRYAAQAKMRVVCSNSASRGLHVLRNHPPDVVMLDVLLPDMSGIDAFKTIQAEYPRIPVVFITEGGASDPAIEAMRMGAFDYVLKPLDRDTVQKLLARAMESRRCVSAAICSPHTGVATSELDDSLIGHSAVMHDVYKSIGRVASQDVPVLIRGENGTGKERVARVIHNYSRRADQPFLTVDCSSIPAALLESELFGVENSEFGHIAAKRIGKLEQCRHGTLFLDEIGDIAPPTQSKLLHLLQEQQCKRVDGEQAVQTDVRLIAATNRNLEDMVAIGDFRQDLYYQLNVSAIDLPPLRERRDDIPLLAEHFLTRFNHELGTDVHGIAPSALQILLHYQWPGNLRELESVLKRAMLRSTGPVLLSELFSHCLQITASPLPSNSGANGDWRDFVRRRIHEGTDSLYTQTLQRMENQLLTEVLAYTHGNKLQAAKILGMTRGTLRSKLSSLGITVERVVGREP